MNYDISPYRDEEIPCIDCITLAICRSRIMPFNHPDTYLRAVKELTIHCSLIKEYIIVYNNETNKPIVEKISTHRCRLAMWYITEGAI